MTSINVSSEGPQSISSNMRLLIWLRCLLCMNCGPFTIYIIFPTLLSIVLTSSQDLLSLKIPKKTFSPGLECFVGTMFVLPGFVSLGSNLSYTDRILRANITSASDYEAGVLLFGVILYT